MEKYKIPEQLSPFEIASLNEILDSPMEVIFDYCNGEEQKPSENYEKNFSEYFNKQQAWIVHNLTKKRTEYGGIEKFILKGSNSLNEGKRQVGLTLLLKLKKITSNHVLGSYLEICEDVHSSFAEHTYKMNLDKELE